MQNPRKKSSRCKSAENREHDPSSAGHQKERPCSYAVVLCRSFHLDSDILGNWIYNPFSRPFLLFSLSQSEMSVFYQNGMTLMACFSQKRQSRTSMGGGVEKRACSKEIQLRAMCLRRRRSGPHVFLACQKMMHYLGMLVFSKSAHSDLMFALLESKLDNNV
jgi:hypothetical protein